MILRKINVALCVLALGWYAFVIIYHWRTCP